MYRKSQTSRRKPQPATFHSRCEQNTKNGKEIKRRHNQGLVKVEDG